LSALQSLFPTAIPAEHESLRTQVRSFLVDAVTRIPAHIRARSWSGYDPAFSRELGRRGWLGLTLPEQYGGGGRRPFARFGQSAVQLFGAAGVLTGGVIERLYLDVRPMRIYEGASEVQRIIIGRRALAEAASAKS